ncbi:MAG: hypothetical protein GC147_04655 [Porphyrobacter sp.]|nr:hypothetical protein [Porphyrobacter sp.]
MPTSQEIQALPTQTDRAFQERFWTIQRFGWAAMFVLVIAAVTGLSGAGGPLAHGLAHSGEAQVSYPRISRWQAADELRVDFPSGFAAGAADVVLPESFLDVFTVEGVTPQPQEVAALGRGQRYRFVLGPAGSRRTAHFAIRAKRPAWPNRSHAVAVEGRTAAIRFLVLPSGAQWIRSSAAQLFTSFFW